MYIIVIIIVAVIIVQVPSRVPRSDADGWYVMVRCVFIQVVIDPVEATPIASEERNCLVII